ncbi:MAG: DNA-processing protein DprA [Candidatus Woesearchaeota archaeon]
MAKSTNIERVTPDDLIGSLNDIEKKFAPLYLFLRGNPNIVNQGPRVSIIGTRKPSKKGIDNALILTKSLVKKGVVIVSGLAEGIDTVAHRTAIESGGKTIAVLGTPLDKYYPLNNRQLQNEIMENHLAISQFPLGSPIMRKNFPLRNRTMALLSHVSIIIEAGERSGTQHQGWEALRLGRRLFILEDIIQNNKLKWPQEMIKYGAEILQIKNTHPVFEALPICEQEVEANVTF